VSGLDEAILSRHTDAALATKVTLDCQKHPFVISTNYESSFLPKLFKAY